MYIAFAKFAKAQVGGNFEGEISDNYHEFWRCNFKWLRK